MKLTDKQIEDFDNEKEKLLEKIKIYEKGVDFAEQWCEKETRKRQWIKLLKDAVKDETVLAQVIAFTNIESAVVTERYLKDIEIIVLKEFGGLIEPFNYLIPDYQRKIRKILLKVEI